jgi:hypothetical protein
MDDAKDPRAKPTDGNGAMSDAEVVDVAKPKRPWTRKTAPTRRAQKEPPPETSALTDPPPDTGATTDPPLDTGAPTRDEMSVAFTPGQMAVGGAIVAGLIVVGIRLLLGRRRGRD